MKKKLIVFLFFTLLSIIFTEEFSSKKVRIVTTVAPPFQYKNDKGETTGASYEIVKLLLKELNQDIEIEWYPWARAYKMSLEEENIMIFSLLRTEEREKEFKWVDSLYPIEFYFYKNSSRKDIKIEKLEDAKKYLISGLRNGAGTLFLESKEFPRLDKTKKIELFHLKLISNRVDLVIDPKIVLEYMFNKNEHDLNKVEAIFKIEDLKKDLYLAFGLKTNDKIIEKYRNAMRKIKETKDYNEILKKYGIE